MSDFSAQILPRSNVTSVVINPRETRLYVQNNDGAIFESIFRDGSRLTTTATNLRAKKRSPLASVSFENGNEVRIYYLDDNNRIREWAFTQGRGWYAGGLTSRGAVSDNTSISAIFWERASSREIRVYFQAENTTSVREITHVLGQAQASENVVTLPV